jgi:hypothetical protein
MTKLNKEQREALALADAAAERARLQALVDTYPQRLMDALSRALAQGAHADVDAQGMFFSVVFRDSGRVINVSYAHGGPMDEEYLQDLLFEVGNLEFQREEERRLEQVRVTALAKLSDEEIKVLGLINARLMNTLRDRLTLQDKML